MLFNGYECILFKIIKSKDIFSTFSTLTKDITKCYLNLTEMSEKGQNDRFLT